MTRLTATSAEALYLAAAVNLLANSAAFRTAVGAASAAVAPGWIVESWGGHQRDPLLDSPDHAIAADGETRLDFPCAHGHVHIEGLGSEETAYRCSLRSGTYLLTIYMPTVTGDSPPDAMRRAWNAAGAICDEVRALIGTVGYPAYAQAGPTAEILLPEPDSFWKNYLIAQLTLNWSS
jgi:hypothetical protein